MSCCLNVPAVMLALLITIASQACGDPVNRPNQQYDVKSHQRITAIVEERTQAQAYPDRHSELSDKPIRISCVHIDPLVDKSRADIKVELQNTTDKAAALTVQANLADAKPAAARLVANVGPHGTAEVLLCVSMDNPRPWSPEDPHLYSMQVRVTDATGKSIDSRRERFGMRSFKIGKDLRFYLNGRPVYLRGNTWAPAGYATLPFEPSFCTKMMIEQKKQGFNYLRHHSTVPPHDWYYDLADELGLMVEVEMGWDLNRSKEVVRDYYNHPSIIIWGGKNEVMHTGSDPQVQAWYKLIKSLDATRYVIDTSGWGEYDRDTTDILNQHFGYDYPYLAFEDMYSNYCWYQHCGSCKGLSSAELAKTIQEKTFKVDKPQTIHELQGNAQVYSERSLILDARMKKVWDLFGFDDADWPTYWKACQKFANVSWKLNMEAARRSDTTCGFDWLTVADSIPELIRESRWPGLGDLDITGTCDALGDSKPYVVADFPVYNAAHVMLIDTHCQPRTLWCGESIKPTVMTSCYDYPPPAVVQVNWSLKSQDGSKTYQSGVIKDTRLKYPGVGTIGNLNIPTPELSKPACLLLSIEASAESYKTANSWKFWAFPRFDRMARIADKRIYTTLSWVRKAGFANHSAETIVTPRDADLLITDRLGAAELNYLNQGGRMLLLQDYAKEGISCTPHAFRHRMYHAQIYGHSMGVVVHNHPALGDFPHEGFSDLQFFPMMRYPCQRIVLDDMPQRIRPILESVPSLENNQSKNSGYLFEVGIGKGQLLATGLLLSSAADGECTSSYMLGELLKYCTSEKFSPASTVTAPAMADAMAKSGKRVWTYVPMTFYPACVTAPCTIAGHPRVTGWIAPKGLGFPGDEWGWHGETEATDGYRFSYWEADRLPADIGADWNGKSVELARVTVEFLDSHSLPAKDGWQLQVSVANGQWKTLSTTPRQINDLTWQFELGGIATDKLRLLFTKMSDQSLRDAAQATHCCWPRTGDPFPITRVKERAVPRIREMKVELVEQ